MGLSQPSGPRQKRLTAADVSISRTGITLCAVNWNTRTAQGLSHNDKVLEQNLEVCVAVFFAFVFAFFFFKHGQQGPLQKCWGERNRYDSCACSSPPRAPARPSQLQEAPPSNVKFCQSNANACSLFLASSPISGSETRAGWRNANEWQASNGWRNDRMFKVTVKVSR